MRRGEDTARGPSIPSLLELVLIPFLPHIPTHLHHPGPQSLGSGLGSGLGSNQHLGRDLGGSRTEPGPAVPLTPNLRLPNPEIITDSVRRDSAQPGLLLEKLRDRKSVV